MQVPALGPRPSPKSPIPFNATAVKHAQIYRLAVTAPSLYDKVPPTRSTKSLVQDTTYSWSHLHTSTLPIGAQRRTSFCDQHGTEYFKSGRLQLARQACQPAPLATVFCLKNTLSTILPRSCGSNQENFPADVLE
jgi:hypothetical protein